MKSVDPGILSCSTCFSFTPPSNAKKMLFYSTWCGHYYCNENYSILRASYPPLLVAFIRQGIMHVKYRGESRRIQRGDVILLDCSEPHHYYAEDGLEFLYMHFDGSNSHEICFYITRQLGWHIQCDSNVLVGKLLFDMVDFYEHDGFETPMQMSMRIYHLFELLMTPAGQEEQSSDPISDVIQYIRAHIDQPVSLDELAAVANLSPYYFAHRFKQQTGFSPVDYVINARIERAKVLLIRTDQSVSQIADEVGYASSNSLINLFVKRVGVSPKQYRKEHFTSAAQI